jgi:pimeloyl-ACP methyl ester carboxylesterase
MLTLVLLPGMDGRGLFFRDFVAAIPPELEPVVVQYPNDPELGYSELEALALAVLPRDRPFILLGESFPGPIAISIAASNPTGLRGLILCCAFARRPHPLRPLTTAAQRPLPAGRLPAFILPPNLFGRFDSPRFRAQLAEVHGLVSANTLKSRLEAVAHTDVSDKLRQVAVPITLSPRETRSPCVACLVRLRQEGQARHRGSRLGCAAFFFCKRSRKRHSPPSGISSAAGLTERNDRSSDLRLAGTLRARREPPSARCVSAASRYHEIFRSKTSAS